MNKYHLGSLINNRYEVVFHPLLGGMGVVYLCLDRQKDIPVALKTFRPEYLPDREARDRFLREGTAWMDLGSHAHIVRCYGVERIGDGTELFLVLEQVAKEHRREDASLRSWLRPGHPLPVDQALLFALQIARGMRHASVKIPGFVHRDLKPENVLVGADKITGTNINRLRVTDFGLAHVLSDNSDWSAKTDDGSVYNSDSSVVGNRTQLTRGIVGTPWYMAPEQWKGEPVNTATDVYALGCILYEMVAGRTLVVGKTIEELEFKHSNRKFGPLPSGLSEDVIETIKRCLSSNPARRYLDWEHAIAALERAYQNVTGKTAPVEEMTKTLNHVEQVALGWGYDSIGFSYLDIGKAVKAKSYFERVRTIGQAQKEKELEAIAIGNLGLVSMTLGNAQQAIEYYEQALAIAREFGYLDVECTIHDHMGIVYNKSGDVQRASDYFEKALAIARRIGDRDGEGGILGNLGSLYLNPYDGRRAIGYYEQSLKIARDVGNRRVEGTALGNLGNAYLSLDEADRAIEYYNLALAVALQIGDRSGEGLHLGNLANAYLDLGNTQRVIEYCEQALEVDRDIGNIDGVARHSFNMARAYEQQGEIGPAIDWAQEAERMWSQIGNPSAEHVRKFIVKLQNGTYSGDTDYSEDNPILEVSKTFARAGSISEMQDAVKKYPYMTDNDFVQMCERILDEQALPQDKLAIKQRLEWLKQIADKEKSGFFELLFGKRKLKNKTKLMNKLANDGNTYLKRGDAQQAIKSFEQVLIIVREIGPRVLEGGVLFGMGEAYEKLGDKRRAIEFFEQSLAITRKIKNWDIVAENLLQLSRLYLQQEDYARGISMTQDAAQILAKIGDPRAQQVHQMVANLQAGFAQSKSDKEAFDAFLNADSLAEMKMTAKKYPFVTDYQFIQQIEKFIDEVGEQVPLQRKIMYNQHLDWLKQIANKK
jgi:tetratricopeptide (TPR) repeat protein